MKRFFILLTGALVAGCGYAPDWNAAPQAAALNADVPAQAEVPSTVAAIKPPPTARTMDEFDTTTAADKAAAVTSVAGGTDLGLTIASLGAAGEPGFWLKTPLAAAPGPGRVVYPANGKSVKVDLIPIAGDAGAGSRISLGALRVLEAPLAGLPELQVFSLK